MLVYVTGKERNIGLFGKDILILRGERKQLVVLLEAQQIVTEIDDNIAISRQSLDGLAADFGRLPKITLEAEISLLLAQHLRHHFHLAR